MALCAGRDQGAMSFETIRLGLWNAQQAHKALMDVWTAIKPYLIAGHRLHVEVRAEKRTDPMNRRMWAMLTDVAEQVEWYGQKLSPEDFKHILSASLQKQRVAPGLDGGFVVLGLSTSAMTKAEHSELMELIAAFGAERGVEFKEPQEETA